MKTLLTLLCVVLLCGCSGVVMREPLPETILTQNEQKELSGTWAIDKSIVYLAFTDSGNPRLASVEWENGAFRLDEHPLNFSKTSDALYVSMKEDGKDGTNAYLFAELRPDGDKCLVWIPETDQFEKLVKDGTLGGTVVKDKHSKKVILDAPGAAILGLLSTNSAAINYKAPMIFRKID